MGTVLKIQRYCIQDGPGIRTTVFLKGCPLHCLWCHNPESLRSAPEPMWHANLCQHCGACAAKCAKGCHTYQGGKHTFQSQGCTGCGECQGVCSHKALESVGQSMTADEVLAQVNRDKIFYRDTGGMTLSGGEPLAQPHFAIELLERARAAGIHTAIETSGFAPRNVVKAILPFTDIFLFDWKETDPYLHQCFTGQDNLLIQSNLAFVCSQGKQVILRCPIIPGYNNREDHFAGIAQWTHTFPTITGVDIEPYHNLGTGKIQCLGKEAGPCFDIPSLEEIAQWKARLSALCRCPVSVPAYDTAQP